MLGLCEDIMKEFKKIAVAPNGLVMAHAGPSRRMNDILLTYEECNTVGDVVKNLIKIE